ncbi:hypothetical protein JHD48_06770 [Sulfurimonas sp. SAG-AH-194-I05]|nr:hypothetical protein [Sulfurimonas sp. SAG-AH-194-I05]MDF1875432.1 hypothetical protein [Sulfurimonas sp. SAG-AH-194-I05]
MNKNTVRLYQTLVLLTTLVMFTSCLDGMQQHITNYIHPIVKCSNKNVVYDLQAALNKNLVFATKVEVNEGSILLVGVNETTHVKTCAVKIRYRLDTSGSNPIKSFMKKMPIIGNVSKEKRIEYTISRTKIKEKFLVTIK